MCRYDEYSFWGNRNFQRQPSLAGWNCSIKRDLLCLIQQYPSDIEVWRIWLLSVMPLPYSDSHSCSECNLINFGMDVKMCTIYVWIYVQYMCTPDGDRTHTLWILSPLPLPVGLPGLIVLVRGIEPLVQPPYIIGQRFYRPPYGNTSCCGD